MPENNVVPRAISRRTLLGGLAAGAAAAPVLAACGAPSSPASSASAPATSLAQTPSKPVTLNILDVAGNLQLTKPAIEAFKAKHPEIISAFTTSPAPRRTWRRRCRRSSRPATRRSSSS